jgi:hypothetical protein
VRASPPDNAAKNEAKAAKVENSKLPTPAQQLAKAFKNLRKVESYRTVLTVEGGLSNTPDHKLFQIAVRESYDGQIYRTLLHVPEMKTYKYPSKGVRYFEGYWRNVVSDTEGKMLHSFFKFPQEVLELALRHAAAGRWIDLEKPSEEPAVAGEKDEKKADGEKSGEEVSESGGGYELEGSPRGKTVVGGDDAASKSDETVRMPRVMVIEAPAKEALEHYIAVENSGCLGGG